MAYIYDILLNFNEDFFEFYDWNKNDKIIHIKKIPIYQVDNKTLKDILHNKIKINGDFLTLIKDKTEEIIFSFEKSFKEKGWSFKYIKQAYRHFPKEVELIRALSYHSVGENKFDEAIEYCHQALMYVKDDITRSEIWGDIGDIEAHRNERKRHYKAYDKALQYNPDNHSVLNNYAYFLSEEGRNLEQALAMASRAISLSKSNATYLDTMAWVLYKLGRYDEAKRYMQQALSLDREKSVEMALHYGDILFALGDKFMAELYWRKALERGADVKEIEARFKMSKQQ